jgi:CDP-glucose 4,6-dehydratase
MHEAELLSLNITKAREKLGWSPRWNLELTLMETVDWYQQKTLGQSSVAEITIQQIRRYGPLD